MNKSKNIFLFFLLTLSLANIFSSYISGSPIQSHLFNSDALYLPTLFSDIFQNNGRIKDWLLTPAPYFFPDYPAFMLAYLIGSTPYSQIILFALIQTTLTFFAIWFVASVTTKVNSFLAATTGLVVLVSLALSAGEPFVLILNRPLKKSRGPKHHQSLTSQNGLQAIFQLWARGKAPPKSRPFDLKSTFSTAC